MITDNWVLTFRFDFFRDIDILSKWFEWNIIAWLIVNIGNSFNSGQKNFIMCQVIEFPFNLEEKV